jgi:hypothetical protein
VKSRVPKFPKIDKRLLGKWKSDKRKTFLDWNWKKNTAAAKKQRLKSFFGKLILTFTRNRIITRLPHRQWQTSRQYFIIGVDEASVALFEIGEIKIKNEKKYSGIGLRTVKEFFSKPEIKHIHFEKKHFWLSIGNGRNREFFRKLKR